MAIQNLLGLLGGNSVFPTKRVTDIATVFNPDPAARPGQMPGADTTGGLLGGAAGGWQEKITGLLGNPLFNMGVAMMGSRSPHFGGALADGVQGAQGAMMLRQRMADNEVDAQYKRAMIDKMGRPDKTTQTQAQQNAQFLFPNDPEKQRAYVEQVTLKAGANGGAPSSVQEWEYYNNLSQADQKRYLEMKRNQQTYLREIEGAPTLVTAGAAGQGPSVMPLSTAQAEDAAATARKKAESYGTATGKTQADKVESLPGVEQNAKETIATLDALEKHAGFNGIYGLNSYWPIVRGSDRAGANAIRKQIGGKAFLQAFESLKGGGQITEIEGQKATDAITRLTDPSISPKEAKQAIKEFREVIEAGRERARKGITVANPTNNDDPLGLR